MGFFTALEESFYPKVALPGLTANSGFSRATAQTLGWAAQLAYEIEDRPKVERILAA